MKLKTAQLIVGAACEADVDEDAVEVYEGYSGRCMYGKETTGVTGPESDLIACIAQAGVNLKAGSDEAEDFLLDLRNVSYDNMAMDTIFY